MSRSRPRRWRAVATGAALAVVLSPLMLPAHTAYAAGNTVPLPDGQLQSFDATPKGEAEPVDPTLDTNKVLLARAGQHNFRCHRIPALGVNNKGEVVAQWDGRPEGCGDAPLPNHIIQRVSKDNGATFEGVTTVAAGNPGPARYGYSDPSIVIDRRNGHMFSFFVKSYDQGIGGSRPGTDENDRNVLHAVYVKSTDGGASWSQPTFVTREITRGKEAEWRGRFATSGNGIQLQHGDHAGRLLQPYSVWDIHGNKIAVTLFSDDMGATWQRGEPLGTNFDENKLVELHDGRVMINSRQTAREGDRYVAISEDGGRTFGDFHRDRTLVDPANNASIIRAFPNADPSDPKAKVLLFSNAAHPTSRVNGTIKMSCDNGETWTAAKQFKAGAMAYSDMAVLADGNIGILYEAENNDIYFSKFNLSWLGGSCASAAPQADNVTVHRSEPATVNVTVTNPGPAPLENATVQLGGVYGWTFGDAVTVPTVPVGGSQTVQVTVTPSRYADPGAVPGKVLLTAEGSTSERPITFNLQLREGEFPNVALPHTDLSVAAFTSQHDTGSNAATKAIDGNPRTAWHTSWNGSHPLPHSITIDAGAEHALTSVSVLPRQDNSDNGTIRNFEVWTGTTTENLRKVADGQWDNSKAPKIVELDGSPVRYVKVVGTSSFGTTENAWVSIAEVSLRKSGTQAQGHLEVVDNGLHSVVRADANADAFNTYAEGDKLRWTFTVRNRSDRAVTVFPRQGDFANLLPPSSPNCRWRDLKAGQHYTCLTSNINNTPFHTVTAEDRQRGYFEPVTQWDATADQNGASVLSSTEVTGSRLWLNPFTAELDEARFTPKDAYAAGEQIVVPVRVQLRSAADVQYKVEALNGGGLETFTGNYSNQQRTQCGWERVRGNDGYTCYPTYTVTPEALAAGQVTLNMQWRGTSLTEGKGVNSEFTQQITLPLPSANVPDPEPPTPQVVTPLAPAFSDAAGSQRDFVHLPEVPGVQYLLDDVVKTAGSYPAAAGERVVTARAADGYQLAADATTEWRWTFVADACQATTIDGAKGERLGGQWAAYAADTESVGGVGGEQNGAFTNVVDGDPATYWHTPWRKNDGVSDQDMTFPHWVAIDLGQTGNLGAIKFTHRVKDSASPTGYAGQPQNVEVMYSENGRDFRSAGCAVLPDLTAADDPTATVVLPAGVQAQHVWLNIDSAYNSDKFTLINELEFFAPAAPSTE
ncbi:discoidin domain-containing protein, partial [Buchananella hordeovulneris]|uniref:discoidin domain-containing protein n=1 Tax=Buchananella hordeovulneris TaxID=52770 RepID=UPI0026DD613A